jgi:hypothetical protein
MSQPPSISLLSFVRETEFHTLNKTPLYMYVTRYYVFQIGSLNSLRLTKLLLGCQTITDAADVQNIV